MRKIIQSHQLNKGLLHVPTNTIVTGRNAENFNDIKLTYKSKSGLTIEYTASSSSYKQIGCYYYCVKKYVVEFGEPVNINGKQFYILLAKREPNLIVNKEEKIIYQTSDIGVLQHIIRSNLPETNSILVGVYYNKHKKQFEKVWIRTNSDRIKKGLIPSLFNEYEANEPVMINNKLYLPNLYGIIDLYDPMPNRTEFKIVTNNIVVKTEFNTDDMEIYFLSNNHCGKFIIKKDDFLEQFRQLINN